MYFDKKEMKFKSNPKIVDSNNLSNENKFEAQQQSIEQENGMNSIIAYHNNKNNFDEILRSNQLVGTAEYASPEMLSNTVTNNISTDIWALGCIIYKFFHGRTPFKGGNEMVIFDNILNLRYSIKQDVPEIVQDLLKRMLVDSPEKRLGAGEKGGEYDLAALKSHEFFRGVNFSNLNQQVPPVKINPYSKGLEKTKSTGDLNAIFSLKSMSSDTDELNISTGLLSCHSPKLNFKKCQSTQIHKNPSISEFSFEYYTELLEENIIEDYLFKSDEYPNSPVRTPKKEVQLIDEAVFKKREFLMVYTTRKVKLFSNKKIELWDTERNSLLVNYFIFYSTKILVLYIFELKI
jgi:serine/threonine protein kinase